jgi:hypothetical protein
MVYTVGDTLSLIRTPSSCILRSGNVLAIGTGRG